MRISTFKDRLTKPANRAKIAYGVAETLFNSHRALTRINAWQDPPLDILPKYIQAFCRNMARVFQVKIIAVEPIPDRHALWAANHISWMDIPVLGSVSRSYFISKAEVADIPMFGKLAKASGCLFIERGSGDSNTMVTQMANFLKQGHSIIFFPEATTSDGTSVHRIYGKLLQSAIDADVPIQPVVTCYVNSQGKLDDKVPYYGGIGLKESILNVMDSEPVTAYVLPLNPLSPKGKDLEQLTGLLQITMQEGLKNLHKQVLKP